METGSGRLPMLSFQHSRSLPLNTIDLGFTLNNINHHKDTRFSFLSLLCCCKSACDSSGRNIMAINADSVEEDMCSWRVYFALISHGNDIHLLVVYLGALS